MLKSVDWVADGLPGLGHIIGSEWGDTVGDCASPAHLTQALSNIAGDSRFTSVERAIACNVAREQHERLQERVEVKPDTWNNARAAAGDSLATPANMLGEGIPGDCVGHVRRLERFIGIVSQQTGRNRNSVVAWVHLAVEAGRRQLTIDEQSKLESIRARVRLSLFPLWVYQNEASRTDPYEGVQIGRLPCLLGMPFGRPEPFLAFTVPVASIPGARRPCSYDVDWEFHEFWRPGGKTKPICSERSGATGYPEWICSAPLLADIAVTIKRGDVEDCARAGEDCYDTQ